MRPNRVLLATKGLDLGGLERVVVDLAVALKQAGQPVDVALVNDARDAMVPTLQRSGVVVHRLGGSDHIGGAAARRYASLVGGDTYGIVHAHGPLTAVMCRLLSGRTPVVSTLHTVWGALRPATRRAWIATLPAESATVAVSDAVVRSLPTWMGNRATVIPHGVDPQAVRDALISAQARRDSTHTTAVIVASHRPAKGYPTLLQALKQARDNGVDLRLIAVGEGPDLAANRSLAQSLGLGAVVDFRPPTPHVLTTIAEADFLVVSSRHEGQPLVVVEALALGRPVVATAVGRVPDVVTREVGRVVPPADVAQLSDAMTEIAWSAELRQEMQDAAMRMRIWTPADAAHRYLQVYALTRRR